MTFLFFFLIVTFLWFYFNFTFVSPYPSLRLYAAHNFFFFSASLSLSRSFAVQLRRHVIGRRWMRSVEGKNFPRGMKAFSKTKGEGEKDDVMKQNRIAAYDLNLTTRSDKVVGKYKRCFSLGRPFFRLWLSL